MTGKFPINCPKCQRKITVDAKQLGKIITCPGCKSTIHLDDTQLKKDLKNLFRK